jgi:hypothetical protein
MQRAHARGKFEFFSRAEVKNVGRIRANLPAKAKISNIREILHDEE